MGSLGNQSVHILVVDQDAQSGNQIRQTLIDEGYSSWFSTDGAQAIELARQQMPSLMIVDTDLGRTTGFDLCRSIQAEYPRHDIPVIFVSKDRNTELISRSKNAGGIYFLGKPLDPSVLLELASKALWMPHLIKCHIDTKTHNPSRKGPRMLSDIGSRQR
ncbi:MAG: response regulator [Planctomycetaceae bacterium]|nr:response regulator [Planctomycetaceae bacterium]